MAGTIHLPMQVELVDGQRRITRAWAMVLAALGGGVAGSGDVTGPGSSVNGQLATWAGTSGTALGAFAGTGVVHATSGVAVAGSVVPADIATGYFLPQIARVVVPWAAIKTLPTTPVTIVPAPVAANTRVKVLSCTFFASCTTATFTNIDATYCDLLLASPDSTTGVWLTAALANDASLTNPWTGVTTLLGGAVHDAVLDVPIPSMDAYDAGAVSGALGWIYPNNWPSSSAVIGQAVNLSMDNNGSGDLTGGDANCFLTVFCTYTLETLY